jgi:lysophospholipase L1-like esterase
MPIPAGSRYVAMGSSFASRPGLPSRVPSSPRRAGRSTGNYAHLVARELGLDLHDVTFSGATTSDLLSPSASGTVAQLDAVTPETSLVTITAGGNDVGFAPRLTLASLPWPLRALPSVKARADALAETRATDGWRRPHRRRLVPPAGHTSRPRPRPPITKPGRRSHGRGASTCPCAGERRTTRTRPGWRRSPGS